MRRIAAEARTASHRRCCPKPDRAGKGCAQGADCSLCVLACILYAVRTPDSAQLSSGLYSLGGATAIWQLARLRSAHRAHAWRCSSMTCISTGHGAAARQQSFETHAPPCFDRSGSLLCKVCRKQQAAPTRMTRFSGLVWHSNRRCTSATSASMLTSDKSAIVADGLLCSATTVQSADTVTHCASVPKRRWPTRLQHRSSSLTSYHRDNM